MDDAVDDLRFCAEESKNVDQFAAGDLWREISPRWWRRVSSEVRAEVAWSP
jgi:hypothetical protein